MSLMSCAGMEKEPSANKADELTQLRDWKRKNKLAVTYMWSHIESEWQHLVLNSKGNSSHPTSAAPLRTSFS